MKKGEQKSPALFALSGFAAAVLIPRIPELLLKGSKHGQRALLFQNALLALWRLKSFREKYPLDLVHESFVPICAILSLLGNYILQKKGAIRAGDFLMRMVLSVGAVPSLDAAIEDGWESITSGEADVPALLAMQLGLGLGYTNAAMIILIMLTGGEAIESYALNRAGHDLHSLLEKSPGTANRRISGSTNSDDLQIAHSNCEEVETEKVTPGDILLVKQDEIIPVDGLLLAFAVDNGQGSIDESLLTGEKINVKKVKGDSVLGGTRNKGSPIWIRSTAFYTDSIVSLMKSQLNSALEKKGSLELASKRFAASFTPITLAAAACAWLLGYSKKLPARGRWERVLSVLMSATPCPAGIGVPIAMLSGMSIATKQYGATIKSGAALETLAKVTTVVLDKTGTITKGEPSVISLKILAKSLPVESVLPEAEIIRLIASAELLSSHPLARAIRQYYNESYGKSLYTTSKVTHHDGAGLTTEVNGYIVHVGLHDFFQRKNIAKLSPKETEDRNTVDLISSYFKIESPDFGYVEGKIFFDDEIRKSVYPFIDHLNGAGIRTVILSGDRSGHLQNIAENIGITDFHSCWPHEKAEHVLKLREAGETVLMIGDGSNDSAALAAADVGLSIGASKIAAESADIVLMNEDLMNISKLVETGKRVVQIAERTVKYGMGASLVQMFFATLGVTSPFVSACLQECVDLSAVLYALRALFTAVN